MANVLNGQFSLTLVQPAFFGEARQAHSNSHNFAHSPPLLFTHIVSVEAVAIET